MAGGGTGARALLIGRLRASLWMDWLSTGRITPLPCISLFFSQPGEVEPLRHAQYFWGGLRAKRIQNNIFSDEVSSVAAAVDVLCSGALRKESQRGEVFAGIRNVSYDHVAMQLCKMNWCLRDRNSSGSDCFTCALIQYCVHSFPFYRSQRLLVRPAPKRLSSARMAVNQRLNQFQTVYAPLSLSDSLYWSSRKSLFIFNFYICTRKPCVDRVDPRCTVSVQTRRGLVCKCRYIFIIMNICRIMPLVGTHTLCCFE